MSEFTYLIDLASERLGGRALAANDDFFAPKENLLRREAPVFIPDKYTDRGKWMDGWESRRRRTPGHDWCIVRLGAPGVLKSIFVDTAFFRGNFPSHCSLDACAMSADASVDELSSDRTQWITVLPKSELRGDTQNLFATDDPRRFTHLRLNIYPDGGVARLRVMGKVLPDWRRIFDSGGEIDLVSIVNGGHVLDTSDRFFGEPHNMLMPDRAPNMGDGWETKRRRGPGHDWSIVQLGVEGTVRRIEIDTAHFKGNYPDSCSVEIRQERSEWMTLLPQVKLQPDHLHIYEGDRAPASQVRLNIYPDGGVSRFRVFGEPTQTGRQHAMLRLLNALPEHEARAHFQDFCGAPAWIDKMLARRPFDTPAALFSAANASADALSTDQWIEALRHHPKIGGQTAERNQSETAKAWSAGEQAAVKDADSAELSMLADLNRAYEARFGYVFVVCAAGRSVADMTATLKQRMGNDPDSELRMAAAEHRRITTLRLEKFLT
jgi:allantoicase